jgi:predicted nucleic acid-binding Zn ribbon protein
VKLQLHPLKTGYFMKCPICKEEIEDDAKKCKHCGNYTAKGRRRWEVIKDVVQFVTFISAIVVLYLMYQGNQKMQEQLNLQRKSIEELSKEFIEEKRPRIEIRPTKIDLSDTTMLLYVDIDNTGFADAEDVFIYVVLKYEDEPKDTLAVKVSRISKITKARALTEDWFLILLHRANLTCLIEVRYTWVIQNRNYIDPKYFQFIYDKELEKYNRISVLTKEQIERLWE